MRQAQLIFGEKKQPLVVSLGYGVDSVALIVGLCRLGIRPDLIQFADVGSEKDDTVAYIKSGVLDRYLEIHGFPPVTICRYQPKDYKHWPAYHSLEENLLTNVTYPSIAYGRHSCSLKWKVAPMNEYLENWQPAIECWSSGRKVIKAIGYDDGTRDRKRCDTFQCSASPDDLELFEFRYFLQEWRWNRDRCIQEIIAEGLPVPPKSSCYFCAAMKPHEVDALSPSKLKRIVIIEQRAAWRQRTTEGLWRSTVKGCRGATPKPGRMTDYIRAKGLLPAKEIDRLISATPTHHIKAGEITDWQTFLHQIEDPTYL